jgi:hypothetical protein
MFGLFDSARDDFKVVFIKRHPTVYEDGTQTIEIRSREPTCRTVLRKNPDDDSFMVERAPDDELTWLARATDEDYKTVLGMIELGATKSGLFFAGFRAYTMVDGEPIPDKGPWGPKDSNDSALADKPKPESPEEPDSCEPVQD